MKLLFCPEIGNSTMKVWGMLLNGTQTTHDFTLDSLAVLLPDDHAPGTHPSMLRSPVTGIYGTRAREQGARLIKEQNIYRLPEFQLLYFSALAEFLTRFAPTATDVEIPVTVLGFPAIHTSQGEYVSRLLMNDGNAWTVQKDGGKAFSVRIGRVVTNSQPYFMMLDQLFNSRDGQIVDDRAENLLANGAVLALDWGASSVDYIILPSTLKRAIPDCSMRGTFALLSELRALAYAVTNDTIPEYELIFHIFREKRLLWNGIEYDFTEQVNALVASMIPAILKDVETFLKKYSNDFRPYALYLGGGGVIHAAPYLREAFGQRFPGGIHIVKDDHGKEEPVYSVMRGMGKQAKLSYDFMQREAAK